MNDKNPNLADEFATLTSMSIESQIETKFHINHNGQLIVSTTLRVCLVGVKIIFPKNDFP